MAVKTSSKQRKNELFGYIVIISVIVVILAAIVYVYKAQQLAALPEETSVTQPNGTTETAATPTPTPTKLFHGKDTYHISGGAPDDPHFPQVDIDPLDPDVGTAQAYTVKIISKYPVTTAFLTIKTDSRDTKVPLSLTSGTRQDGIWQATWTMPETYLYNYQITPTAQTAYTQGSATITVRQRL